MKKEYIVPGLLKEFDSSKRLEAPNQGRTGRLAFALVMASVVLVVLGVLPVTASAAIEFDGKKCYVSDRSESLQITDKGYLQWNSPGPQQLVIKLDDIELVEIGDIAEVKLLYKVDGSVPDAAGLRVGLFDSKASGSVKDDGFDISSDMWKGYNGY